MFSRILVTCALVGAGVLLERFKFRPNTLSRVLKRKYMNEALARYKSVVKHHDKMLKSPEELDKGLVAELTNKRDSIETMATVLSRQYEGLLVLFSNDKDPFQNLKEFLSTYDKLDSLIIEYYRLSPR